MKAVILALAIAGAASAAPVSAQVPSRGIPTTSTSRNTSVDGSWRAVGQDRSGTIYERRTYDSYGNIVVQRARRDANGNLRIIDTRTVQANRNDCQNGTNSTVGDIVFGRTGTNNNCQYNGSSNRRVNDGVWRQVGQGPNNNSIYERRTTDQYGNVVVQRGRRNSNGSFTVLSTRTIRNNRNVNGNNGSYNNGSYDRGHGDGDDDDNRQLDNRRGDSDEHYNKSERKGNGKGKGKKDRD